MKKILENIEKNELLEYYRSSSGKFAVGNFVGINNDFAIFTSISPFGRFEGYRFIKIEDLKNIGKKKLYLEFMKKRIEERKSKHCKSIILKKDRFFKELFKYFIKNKIEMRINLESDIISYGYLIKNSKNFFHIKWYDENNENSEEILKVSQIKSIEIGKNVIKNIVVEGGKIEKNKIIEASESFHGNVIFQDDDYILIYENDLFYGDENFLILKTSDIWEIIEKVTLIETEDTFLEKIFPNIEKMNIKEILKKCFENKLLVHFEYEKSYYEKYGIIEKYDKDKIILKEIGKNSGVFIVTSEIAIDEITFLNLRNTKIK